MKPKFKLIAAAGLTVAAMSILPGGTHAASYNIANSPGWNLIANQLDAPNGNNIRVVIPNAPAGSLLRRFNLATRTFDTLETFSSVASWQPGTTTLNPGDGLYFSNAASATFTMTINGNPHIPTLPLNPGLGGILVARQTNDTATVTNILGFAPPNNTVVYRFLPGPGRDPNVFSSVNYTIHALRTNVWTTPPGPPNAIRIGESVWITTNGSPALIVSQPQSQVACSNRSATFTVVATGTAPLSYQWMFNGNPISGATSNIYSIAQVQSIHVGTYSVAVSNPLGNTNSVNATLEIGDVTPPSVGCPTGISATCAGPNGTVVTFNASANDACDGPLPVTCVPASGSAFPPGNTTVTCSATDSHDNKGSCSFVVNVSDFIPPVARCPSNLTAIATGPNGAQVFYTATATDNCDPNPSISCTPPSGSTFPIGFNSITCTAADASGNTNICTFRITVSDPPCCDTKDWSVIAVTGNSPGPRKFHGMAYDSARHRVVLFGGTDASGALRNDTWEYDGTQWFLISSPIAPPSPRQAMGMTYDSSRARVVLFGGRDSTVVLDDTWEWNGANWQKTTIAGAPTPHARWQHAMAYDSFRRKVVLFGGDFGGTASTLLGDTWEYDAAGWVQVADVGPSRRFGHAMASTASNRVLLNGGVDYSGNPFSFLDDSWQWDGTNWVQVAAGSPPKRGAHAMYYDTYCQRTFMFGGAGVTGPFQDTWQWDDTAWSQLSPATMPARRSGHAMVFDSDNGRGILYGGVSGQTTFGDMWQLRDGQGASTPLSIVSVEANCGENKVTIVFNRGLKAASALDPSHYNIFCQGVPAMGITQVQFGPDNRTICLFTQGSIGSGCFLSLFVEDLCGSTLEQSQYPFTCDPCGSGSGGRDFWVTFPGNYAPDPTNRPKLSLYIAGNPGTMGQVAAPGLIPPFLVNYVIPAGRVATVNLPSDADLGDTNDVIEAKGVHVTASQKVSVYGLNHIKYTTDAFMALPSNVLGRAYLVLSYQNIFNGIPELNGNQFAVVATEDNTKIGILPSAPAAGHPAGVPFFFTLQKGQTYQLRCTNDAPNDLTGSIVVADKPIGVFGAHRCANIPSNDVFFCDHLVEQLWPTALWGTDFITQRLATRKYDTFRIMALQNNTTVRTNGVIVNGTSINQGAYHELILHEATHVTADKPVLVAEFANSSDYDLVTASDPFMVLVPPTTMYGIDYTVQVPTTDFVDNYVNIVVPTAAAGTISLDGGLIGAGNFGAVPGTAYSTAAVHVATGPHRLTSTGTPFGAIVYGWGTAYDSYGYPAGLCAARDQRPPPPIQCPTNVITADLGTNCFAVVPDLRSQVTGALVVDQDPPPGTHVGIGPTHITLTASDIYGDTKTCLVDFIVSGGLNIFCPNRVETNCVTPQGTIVQFTIGKCDESVQITCQPASGTLFPPGTTTVVCNATDGKGLTTQCTFPVQVRCQSLTISRSGNQVTITFSGGTLQQANSVSGSQFTDIVTTSPYTIQAPTGQKIFRLRLDP